MGNQRSEHPRPKPLRFLADDLATEGFVPYFRAGVCAGARVLWETRDDSVSSIVPDVPM